MVADMIQGLPLMILESGRFTATMAGISHWVRSLPSWFNPMPSRVSRSLPDGKMWVIYEEVASSAANATRCRIVLLSPQTRSTSFHAEIIILVPSRADLLDIIHVPGLGRVDDDGSCVMRAEGMIFPNTHALCSAIPFTDSHGLFLPRHAYLLDIVLMYDLLLYESSNWAFGREFCGCLSRMVERRTSR